VRSLRALQTHGDTYMIKPSFFLKSSLVVPKAAACMALLATGSLVHASEGFKSRQSPIGAFGGEIASAADNPGFFGTAIATYVHIYKVADENGNDVSVAARSVPLPTNSRAGLPIADGTYKLIVPAGTIKFDQSQSQVNLIGGYMTEATYADGRLAFAVNLPLISISRTFSASQPAGTIAPAPAAALPAAALGAITTIANTTNFAVQSALLARNTSENQSVSGLGDAELSAVWVRHRDRMKVAAGVSLFVPTGAYDKARGPNPGFGNFYTLRPGVAVTYSLNPNHKDSNWDSGVTVAGRLSYGINSSNLETDYKSGDFVYSEAAITKVSGSWAFGANVLSIQQVTDDSGAGAVSGGNRYRNYGFGPFLSYKLPGKDAGFNLHFSRNFGSQNALVSESVQFRFIKAW
jgi:hypothetical protein